MPLDFSFRKEAIPDSSEYEVRFLVPEAQSINPEILQRLQDALEASGIGSVFVKKASELEVPDIDNSPNPRRLNKALEYSDSVITDVAGIDNFVDAIPASIQSFSTLDIAAALRGAGLIPDEDEMLKIGASATLLSEDRGAEVIEGQIFRNRQAFLLTKAATADDEGNLKVFRLRDDKRVILENQVLLKRDKKEDNNGVFIRIQVARDDQDLYTLLANAIQTAGISHCSVRATIFGPLRAKVAVIRGIPAQSISSKSELNQELVPFEKTTEGPFHIAGSITNASSRLSTGWERVMNDAMYARKGHHHGYSEKGDVGGHILALYPQPSSTVEIIIEPARVVQVMKFPKKNCCPNACPDLNGIGATLDSIRNGVKTSLLRSAARPIGFLEADQGRVLDSVRDPKVMTECANRLAAMLMYIEVTESDALLSAEQLVADVARCSSYDEIDEIGLKWHQEFQRRGFSESIEKLMMGRNHWVADLIAPHLLAGTVLDHDAGDSYVARFIQKQRPDVEVYTQDAFDFRKEVTDLPIVFYDYAAKRLPYPDGTQFDNAILATVLHHCDEPEKMFDEVARLLRPGGRLFVFENVFTQGDSTERDVNVFFDWFFNKIFHRCGLPLPFSHFCRDQWRDFLSSKGFDILEAHEDLDHWPSIPLEHVLYVAEKK